MNEVKSEKESKFDESTTSIDQNDPSKKQIILYFVIVAVSLTIFIISMIGINLFILLIIIGIVLVYVYFDKDIENSEDIKS